jgi:hypothetical protein
MSAGIDIPIDDLITLFTARLWTTKTRQFYGRIFRMEVKDGYVVKVKPLYYGAVGADPVETLKDDRKDAQCFVDVMPVRKMNADVIDAECRVLFMVNLTALYPALTRTEAIEQVMLDVKQSIIYSEFQFIQMVSGYEAFNDYQWSEDALSDLKGHHLFRFDLKINYIND